MKTQFNINTLVWILLVTLIIVSYLFAENDFKHAPLLIVAFAIVKFISVSFQFVEVKKAHIVWKIVTLLFVFSYLILYLAI